MVLKKSRWSSKGQNGPPSKRSNGPPGGSKRSDGPGQIGLLGCPKSHFFMKKPKKSWLVKKVEKVAKMSKRVLGGPSSCLKGNLTKKIVKKCQKITLFIKKAIKHEVPKAVRSGNLKVKKGPKIALGSTDFFWRKSLHLTLDKNVPVFLPPKRSRF